MTSAIRTHALTDRELGELELLLQGAWPAPPEFGVPEQTAAGDQLELTDPEGAPVAMLRVVQVRPSGGRDVATGELTALRPVDYGPFRRLRRTPEQVRAELGSGPVIARITAEPLQTAEIAALREQAGQLDARVLVLAAIGDTGAIFAPQALVHALLAAQPELPGSLVIPIPLSTVDDDLLSAHVAAAFGATHVASAHSVGASPLPIVPLPEVDRSGLVGRLDAGTEIPENVVPAAVAAVLRRSRPPRNRRGLVLFFTGFSGSGKSTVARGVYDRILETATRPVTLLDGDVVRRLLSAGLGFSRADRDLNIRRIGFVAAEIAHAGGIAICAPIAPYAGTRAEVRRRASAAGDFLLVHVNTPLEVCEARDRKGLYAKARAGIIPEFTGISDPYEVPEDADLRLDTSQMSEEDSVEAVLKLLVDRGYLEE